MALTIPECQPRAYVKVAAQRQAFSSKKFAPRRDACPTAGNKQEAAGFRDGMMTGAILLIAQASAAPAAVQASPDVELRAQLRAREVRIEQDGPIRVELRAEPGITDISVERSQPAGAQSYRNLTIDARVAAWLSQDDGPKAGVSTSGSTGEPQ